MKVTAAVKVIAVIFILAVSFTIISLKYANDGEPRQPFPGKLAIEKSLKLNLSEPSTLQQPLGKASTKIVLQLNPSEPSICKQTFPSKCNIYPYVKFWNQQFSREDCYQSPLKHPLGKKAPITERKYVVFQPDGGGWNNIRMAAEVAMIFAHVTGRILVMPPMAQWYLLRRNKAENDNQSTFAKFFDVNKISEAMDIISMEEFITTIAAKGMLNIPLPSAANPTNFARNHDDLWTYLEKACYTREWQPGKYFLGFNVTKSTTTNPHGRKFDSRVNGISSANGVTVDTLTGALFNPIVKDEHLSQFASHGRKVLTYDDKMHVEKVIYFPGDYRNEYRILTHFYTYLYFADEHLEHIYKRIVRDRLHYHDDIFCAAGEVVKLLHTDLADLAQKESKEGSKNMKEGRDKVQTSLRANQLTGGGDTNYDAVYHAIHVRRGDFQYSHTQLSAEQIHNNIKHLLDTTVTRILYISTDEKNTSFFDPFREHFKIRFLSDYIHPGNIAFSNLNQNHIGMVEQIICANAHTFVGTPLSTFTGYITRMRGSNLIDLILLFLPFIQYFCFITQIYIHYVDECIKKLKINFLLHLVFSTCQDTIAITAIREHTIQCQTLCTSKCSLCHNFFL